MAKDSNGRDRELKKRLNSDNYMLCAVREFLGEREQIVINEIFSKVDHHIQEGDLIRELNMSALPSLYEQFLQLIEYLIENRKEDKDEVVIVLLNILEVVTRDIMEDPVPSLLDSSLSGSYGMHEGMTPLDQQHQFFGALRFPVTEETEAWKEKRARTETVFASLRLCLVHELDWDLEREREKVCERCVKYKKASSIAYSEGICYGCAN
ncbi:hypothetical protein CsSME_00011891 [Camellia sinensis var. sinensis]